MLNWKALAPSKGRGLAKTDYHAIHLSPQCILEFTDAFGLCPTSFFSELLLAHFTTALPALAAISLPFRPRHLFIVRNPIVLVFSMLL